MNHLLIISHTSHYLKSDGTVVGLASTITEINHLAKIFDAITHIGMLYQGEPPKNMEAYDSDRINFVPIEPLGGHSLKSKLKILLAVPKVLAIIRSELKKCDWFQFRAPTGIGVFVIPYLTWFTKKPGWFKYAGNWKQDDAPLAYKIQRWFLVNQKRKVTINGSWPDQPSHCISFDNPCLTRDEIEKGQSARSLKTMQRSTFEFCFVGRLEDAKGVDLIINAICDVDTNLATKIHTVHMVGDGAKRLSYENETKQSAINFKFHGWLGRKDVHSLMSKCDLILLPSASEGLPKVIIEAMNYGCIPLISSIDAFKKIIIDNKNGFVLKERSVEALSELIIEFLTIPESKRENLITNSGFDSQKYGYEFYNRRIKSEILGSC